MRIAPLGPARRSDVAQGVQPCALVVDPVERGRAETAHNRALITGQCEIMKVATHTTVTSASLANRLLIPPPFRSEQKDQLAAARRAFLQQLTPATGKALPLGIVVGELKAIEPSQYGRRVIFKHMPGFSFFMDEALCKRFDKVLGGKVMTAEATPGAHLVLIATFNVRGTYAEIREIAGMTVTEQWLPFADERELQLIGALRERHFVKCLTFNLRPEAPIATALLLDTAEPVALFSPSDRLTPDQAAELETIAREGVYGDDTVKGEFGADVIVGGLGADSLSGGSGSDQINGDAGNDTIYGDAGTDVINGGADHDLIEGQDGSDVLGGDDGNDTLRGGTGADIIRGGNHNDLIEGGTGADKLYGDAGNDRIEGGAGADRCAAPFRHRRSRSFPPFRR